MTFAKGKKKAAVGIVTVVTLCMAGAALAYWTQGGSGSGAAGTGTTVDVVVNQTTVVTDLHPGGDAVTLAGNFDNPNPGPVEIGSVTTTGLTVDETHATAGCSASWYTLGGSADVNAEIASGNGVGAWSGLTVVLTNSATVNQDACKGATVTIAYSVSAAA